MVTDTPGWDTDTPGWDTDTPGWDTDTPGWDTDTPGWDTDTHGLGTAVPHRTRQGTYKKSACRTWQSSPTEVESRTIARKITLHTRISCLTLDQPENEYITYSSRNTLS